MCELCHSDTASACRLLHTYSVYYYNYLHEIKQCIIIEQDIGHYKVARTNIFQLIFTEKPAPAELWIMSKMANNVTDQYVSQLYGRYLVSILLNTTVCASSKQSFFTTPSSGHIVTIHMHTGYIQTCTDSRWYIPSMCCRKELSMLT